VTASIPAEATGGKIAPVLQFLGMGLIWGASFLFMKVGLTGLSFTQVALARTVIGALTLAVVVLVARQHLPRQLVVWAHFVVVSLLGCFIPYLCFTWAEQTVSSSLASIYNATTPIMTALMVTLAFRVEKLTRGQVLGILIGVLGVLVIIGPWQGAALSGSLAGQVACLVATASYGVEFAYIRKFLSHRDIGNETLALLTIAPSAVLFLLLTPVIAWQPVQLDIWVIGSMVLLGAFGTGIAYVWSYNVFRAWGPTATSTVTYITPIVGVVLGVIILHESLSWHEPIGAVLVLIGILFAQRRVKLPWDRTQDDAPEVLTPDAVPPPEEQRPARAS
jgi:drug/metabolite transporter (DMT)-like permease